MQMRRSVQRSDLRSRVCAGKDENRGEFECQVEHSGWMFSFVGAILRV